MDLTDDDRATLFGTFLDLAASMRDGDAGKEHGTDDAGTGVDSTAPPSPAPGPGPARDCLARWRRAGLRAFAADREAAADRDAATAAGVTGHVGGETAEGNLPA